jgi:hypothetical protein
MEMSIHNKNGFKYQFVNKSSIKFLPKYKEFESNFNNVKTKVYLLGVNFHNDDILKDQCIVAETSLNNNSDEIDVGYVVRGKDLKDYKKFILPFLPPGL